MADVDADIATGQPKRRTFKKFSFRGVDLDALLDLPTDELVKLFPARARRRFNRGLKRKPMALIKKLRKALFGLLGFYYRDKGKKVFDCLGSLNTYGMALYALEVEGRGD